MTLTMNAADRFRLHKEKQAFLDDLRPKYILPYLVENSILSKYESELISSEKTRRDQVEKLFDILPKKSPKAFKYFIEALNEKDSYGCANYPWLAEKLSQQDEVDLSKNVHETLINGGVPFPTHFLFRREKKIRDIRNHLRSASRKDRQWVVLYGMTGTGKSVLAAECLRCNELIEEHYPGGIFWISIGRIKDDNHLWLKMKRLFTLLGINKELYASEDLQDLTIVIRKEIIKRKKILLVLDDVWDKKVIKAFDIGCPVLVTTKLKDVLKNDSKYYTFIECKNDWSINESKELLSLYVNCDREQLPDFVDYICEKCKGSPMTISLIGSMMSEYGNNFKRWENLKNKLERGIGSTIRHRHGSGDGLSDIKEIVRFSFEPIKELWKYFLDFIIFPEDIFVPNKVFEVMWGMDSFEVEDILHNLYGKSLVQIEKDSFDDSYGYCIHDLYLEILKEDHPNESEYHKKLVTNYMNLCKQDNGQYNFSLLPQDGYIHYHIGYHMYHALEYELLETLYLDFEFIETKLHLDPKDLSWDYIAYSFCFQNHDELKAYEKFVKKISNLIHQNKDSCVLQLALFEPPTSVVYQKARKLALKLKNKAFFEWCNQEENQAHSYNSISKHNLDGMKHAVFNNDSSLIVCVGERTEAAVYLSSTGEEVQTLSGHKDVINYCSFNSEGDQLATASSDRTVKVFEINTTELLNMKPKRKRSSIPVPFVNNHTQDKSAISFEEHCSDAICCAFSPSDLYIISSDNIGIAYVWETATKHIKHKIIHSYRGEAVNFCCFNSDGSRFGTAVNDSIKLWDFKTGRFIISFDHDDFLVREFCFTKKGNNLLSVCDNIIYCWNMSGGCTHIRTGPSKPFEICCCCISPDENYLAYGTSLSSIFVININTQKVIDSLKGHSDAILNVMFSSDGRRLLSLSEDRFIIHDMSSVKDASLVSFEGCLSVRMNEDLSISCAHSLNRVEVRHGFNGKLKCKSDPEEEDISSCSLSYDCSEVIYGTKSGTLKVLNTNSYRTETLAGHESQVNYILHSKSNLTFFTCSEDKFIKMWKEKVPQILKGHTDSVEMCVLFKESEKLLSCSKDGTLKVWDTRSGKMILPIDEGHGNQGIRQCDVSADDKMFASASSDKTVKLWNAENGQLLKTLPCRDCVRCCRFSPSAQVIISGDDSGEVLLWRLGTNPKPSNHGYHDSVVYDIQYSEDGSQFLTISDDIKIWKGSGPLAQTLLLPSSSMGVARPCIWASGNFYVFVVIHNSVLYILNRIE